MTCAELTVNEHIEACAGRDGNTAVPVRRSYSFTIPGRLPGLNEIINQARANRFSGATQKKKQNAFCGSYILFGKVPKIDFPVDVKIEWIEPDLRRDPDNLLANLKFILDALVETGRLPGDSRKWIKNIIPVFSEPDKLNPRIVVTLTES